MAEEYHAIDLAEKMLGDYDSDPDSYGFDLRLDLAELIVRGLKAKGWTQRQLAKAAGVPEQTISKYINSATNFESGTAGSVLFSLGIKPRLVSCSVATDDPGTQLAPRGGVVIGKTLVRKPKYHGEKITKFKVGFEVTDTVLGSFVAFSRSRSGEWSSGPAAHSVV